MDPGPGPTPRGREPVGDCRVGCMGRRSPGRSVGRGAPGACGRGRWKMGWPGTGRPGAGRAGAPGAACPAGAAGLIGALYTGRGPVCGMIMRGGGAPMGAADLGGAVAAGGAAAAGGCAAGGGATADGGATGGAGGLGGAETGALVEALGGAAGGGGGGAITAEADLGCGTTSRGAGGGSGAGFGGAGAFATGAAGLASTGGAAGGTGFGAAGGAAACCFCVISFITSPGFEICERSIFVLISSSPRTVRADLELADEASRDLKTARTFSASWSSRELECVFFSVTPASGRTSRIALLLTSSSLARSLIRILLIRRFIPPPCPAKPSCQPHEWGFLCRDIHRGYSLFSPGFSSGAPSSDSGVEGSASAAAGSSVAARSTGSLSTGATSSPSLPTSTSLPASAAASSAAGATASPPSRLEK